MKNLQSEYNKDFYAWILHNTDLLKQQKFDQVDIENIVEEIECMGKSYRRELISRFAVLVAHLLKWQFQPIRRSKSWILPIKNQRIDIEDLLEESPSLQHEVAKQFNHTYEKAIRIASEETGIDETEFPEECPYTLEQCLDNHFFPE